MPSPGRASHRPDEVDDAGHRLAKLLDMPSSGELSVVPDTQENLEEIAEHSFSVNGDVGLPGRFCTVQAEEGRLALGEVRVNLTIAVDATTLSTSGCKDATIMSLLRALRTINSVGTHKGIVLEFDQEIANVD